MKKKRDYKQIANDILQAQKKLNSLIQEGLESDELLIFLYENTAQCHQLYKCNVSDTQYVKISISKRIDSQF